eukprot:CAMPEP_0173196714 /NCGR_PEP_ID=MMETSP1141-20130122/15768_1 /TAXON_ID=483371 /ORGANISM="non described non described, Strain CCMP2298" /LENGTH=118 /DNA_ID=CAMNT_0014121393 /DNA_START=276 /DNA_END=629 /DNA_ORIENTATION=-
MTPGAVEALKAPAHAYPVVAHSPATAVPARLRAHSHQRIGTGGTLAVFAERASETHVAHAAHGLGGIPRGVVDAPRLVRQESLGPAHTPVVAVAYAGGPLAGDTFVAREALAHTRAPV